MNPRTTALAAALTAALTLAAPTTLGAVPRARDHAQLSGNDNAHPRRGAPLLRPLVHERRAPARGLPRLVGRTPGSVRVLPGPTARGSRNPHPRSRYDGPRLVLIGAYDVAPGSQAAIDACRLDLWSTTPLWLAGHDWCGFAWLATLPTGTRVTVTTGPARGRYVITGRITLTRQGGVSWPAVPDSYALWGAPSWPALRNHGVTGRVTCGVVPLQVEGTLEGCWYYFRARHDHWSCGVSRESSDDAVRQSIDGPAMLEGHDELGLSWGFDEDEEDAVAAFVAGVILDTARLLTTGRGSRA